MINKKHIDLITRNSKWFILCCTFVLCLLTNYHGFSIGYWKELVDSPAKINFIGESQGVRSDDFFVGLPLAFSQKKTHFQLLNPTIGMGQNNLVTSYQLPINHWTALFKPLTWGYFLGPDLGMSWHWNLNVFLLFIATLLFFSSLSSFDKKTVFWLSVGTTFSTFFSFWSYIGAPYFYWPLLMALIIRKVDNSQNLKTKFLLAVFFLWALGCLTFAIYPPFQIFGVYFVAIFAIYFLILSKRKLSLLALYSTSLIAILLLLILWYKEAKEIIHIVSSTIYPGRRFTVGGQGTWLQLFQNNLFLKDYFRIEPRLGGNVSEGSGFWSIYWPLIGLIFYKWKLFGFKEKVLTVISCAFLGMYLLWYFFGLPPIVAQFTGLFMSVEGRSIFFTSFLNLIFLTLLSPYFVQRKKMPFSHIILFLLWMGIQFFMIAQNWSTNNGVIAGTIVMTTLHLVAIWHLFKENILRFAQTWGITMILTSFSFNPIVFGGYEKLFVESPLVQAITATDINKTETWLIDNEVVLSALPRILGLKSYAGTIFYPSKVFWKIVDPDNTNENIWNRYTNLVFRITNAPEVKINLPYQDRVEIAVPKDSQLLSKLGITRIIQLKESPDRVNPPGFTRLSETNCCIIWGRN